MKAPIKTPDIVTAVVGFVVGSMDRLAFHLRKWDEVRRRGQCPHCGDYLIYVKRGFYRCDVCHAKRGDDEPA